MELFALRQEGLQRGDAEGAAEIAHHVEERRSRTGILLLDACGGDRRKRGENERLTDGADDVRPEQLVGGIIAGHVHVHEVRSGEEGKADDDQQAHIEPLHQLRHQRD